MRGGFKRCAVRGVSEEVELLEAGGQSLDVRFPAPDVQVVELPGDFCGAEGRFGRIEIPFCEVDADDFSAGVLLGYGDGPVAGAGAEVEDTACGGEESCGGEFALEGVDEDFVLDGEQVLLLVVFGGEVDAGLVECVVAVCAAVFVDVFEVV